MRGTQGTYWPGRMISRFGMGMGADIRMEGRRGVGVYRQPHPRWGSQKAMEKVRIRDSVDGDEVWVGGDLGFALRGPPAFRILELIQALGSPVFQSRRNKNIARI